MVSTQRRIQQLNELSDHHPDRNHHGLATKDRIWAAGQGENAQRMGRLVACDIQNNWPSAEYRIRWG
ncbi:hypothetical protein YQE_11049, partial [Dendroctonus ponderosae]